MLNLYLFVCMNMQKKKHDMSLNVAYFQYAMISAQKITIWGILISVSDKMNVILIQVWKTFI